MKTKLWVSAKAKELRYENKQDRILETLSWLSWLDKLMSLATKTWVARLASLGLNTAEIENASPTSIELLFDLTAKALDDLSKRCSWRTFQIHEEVIDRQSSSRVLCFIVMGRARVANYALSGREITFVDCKGGAYFSELAALDGEPRSTILSPWKRQLPPVFRNRFSRSAAHLFAIRGAHPKEP